MGKDFAKIGKARFARGRKSFSSQLDKLLLKYEQRNLMLQEKEASVRTRVEMMEAAMPVLLAWNMYQTCIGETGSKGSRSQVTCPIWYSDKKREEGSAVASDDDIQKRKMELDRLIREIRRREQLDKDCEDDDGHAERTEDIEKEEEVDEVNESLSSEESV